MRLNCVPEAFRVGVGEEESPSAAGVGGFVEAAAVPFAAGHHDGSVCVEGGTCALQTGRSEAELRDRLGKVIFPTRIT